MEVFPDSSLCSQHFNWRLLWPHLLSLRAPHESWCSCVFFSSLPSHIYPSTDFTYEVFQNTHLRTSNWNYLLSQTLRYDWVAAGIGLAGDLGRRAACMCGRHVHVCYMDVWTAILTWKEKTRMEEKNWVQPGQERRLHPWQGTPRSTEQSPRYPPKMSCLRAVLGTWH